MRRPGRINTLSRTNTQGHHCQGQTLKDITEGRSEVRKPRGGWRMTHLDCVKYVETYADLKRRCAQERGTWKEDQRSCQLTTEEGQTVSLTVWMCLYRGGGRGAVAHHPRVGCTVCCITGCTGHRTESACGHKTAFYRFETDSNCAGMHDRSVRPIVRSRQIRNETLFVKFHSLFGVCE